MSEVAAAKPSAISKAPGRAVIISALGVDPNLCLGHRPYYLLAVLATADRRRHRLAAVLGRRRRIARSADRPASSRPGLAASSPVVAAVPCWPPAPASSLSVSCVLALAHALPVFLAAWLVIGLGMGAGLYDPAFATLGRLYGEGGRSAITTLTLFGGFASTVCWPLSAFLDAHLGWRGACLVYAGFHLAVALPIYLLRPAA